MKIANYTDFQGQILWDITKLDGTPRKQLNIDRILNMGWKTSIDIDEGIKIKVEIYKN